MKIKLRVFFSVLVFLGNIPFSWADTTAKIQAAGRINSTAIGITVPGYANGSLPAVGDEYTLRWRTDDGSGFSQGPIVDTNYGNVSLLANAVPVDFYCPSAAAHTARTCLDDAVSTLGSTNQHTILIPNPQVISADLTITSNLTLVFQGSGRLDPDAATTTTINGPIMAPLRRIFGGSGSTIFGTSFPQTIYPTWFGATGNGVTDDTAAINNTITAAQANSHIHFPKGNFYVSSPITITKRLKMTGMGTSTQIYQSSTTQDLFVIGSNAVDLNEFTMEDLFLGSSATTAGKAVLKLIRSHRGLYKNIVIVGGYYGLYINGSLINTFINLKHHGWGNFFTATSANQWGVFADQNITGAIKPNANKFYGLILENGVNGLKIDGDDEGGISIYGGTIENNSGTGIELLDSFTPSVVDGVHLEQNAIADIKINDAHSISLDSNYGDGIISIINSSDVAITNSYHNKIEIDSLSKNVKVDNSRYNGLGSGYIRDLAANTKITSLINATTASEATGDNTSHASMFCRNGSMESWSGGLPVGWDNYNGATIVQSGTGLGDTTKKFGVYAAKVTGNAGSPHTGLKQDLTIGMAGQWIFVDAWVYVSSGSAAIDVWINGGVSVIAGMTITTTGQWVRIQNSFLLPAFTSAFVIIKAPNGSVVYFDAIKFWADSTNDLYSLDGNYSRTFLMERHTTANTAGNSLTVQAGGSTSGATDKNGGDLFLAPGTATGTGKAKVQLQSSIAGATGTVDRVPATHIQISQGHLVSKGTAPTPSACGTTPAVTGNDIAGKVTIGGGGAVTSCTVTFATAYDTNAPACTVSGDNAAVAYNATTTTTVMTIASSADMQSDVVSYICLGIE